MEQAAGIRLQKLLAQAGCASRRQAEVMIRAGRVAVNGLIVTDMGRKVLESDEVRLDGHTVRAGQSRHYYLLNKPVGVISSARDPRGRPTVVDLLSGVPVRVYPVGRLDFDTSGLLLLTDDGELAYRLTHPRYGVEKTYRVTLRQRVAPEALRALRTGIFLEDGKTAPARVRTAGRERECEIVEITIHEGRNRQVRRMFAALGYPVLKLERVRFGPIRLESTLKPGLFRVLNRREVEALRKITGLPAADVNED
ncbi:tRNA pseudouridine38-40 synthase [Acididesulfobacillus acetoxydans]|uniref:Pseudouridine synthase n=1 Tax=Acididesulfobacillus acetoxydans TaxID=1561005 RepID=A0A8S0Y3G9_9FIRM|nr:pseudouridine synthase [Acididesulfobacillus acetoxydans]CAA7602055.1 tRNA pseudouridine38-40 synthase [Acididesulfobacillus acetoxydans]CEJ08102.1 Ribosomal large subunit pseudouridine synthase B [Acididesulfobacillus acetoxydans]